MVRFISFAFAVLLAFSASAAALQSKRAQVDQLFAKWNKADSPGAVALVLQDGHPVFSHGYGMANLEYGIKNSPNTVFHMASVSKQFTAFAIHMLAGQGKVKLDDDIHKFIPELHDFGKPISVRQLLHHTSGIRDQWSLLALAGWRLEDVITQDDVMRLLRNQKELNFEPGDKFLYNNSGYTLLSEIVSRVSGAPFSEFEEHNILKPLGMSLTHFQDDYGRVVKNRAYSYMPGDDQSYHYVALSYSTVGPSSLFTTVGDLAKWDENFYTARLGGKKIIADMLEKGRLNNGKEINYGSGLYIGKYRGLDEVWHDGGDAGYRTVILRFPAQHFSVVILANAGDMDVVEISHRIADIYIGDKFPDAPVPPAKPISRAETKIDPALVADYIGDYEINPNFIVSFFDDNGQFTSQATGQPKFPVFASSPSTFFLKVAPAQIEFKRSAETGKVTSVELRQNGHVEVGKRRFRAELTPAQLGEFEGQFYSDELGTIYSVRNKSGKLTIEGLRGQFPMRMTDEDTFSVDFPIGSLKFKRGADGIVGFAIDDGRATNVAFAKVRLPSLH